MNIATILTYVGLALFGFPALLFITMTIMMMKDLSREDETVSFLIKLGTGILILGAVILAVRYFFFY
ncbi:MAG: hypothetical protein V1695_01400 [Candidatus Uhrbacteria bacterium]